MRRLHTLLAATAAVLSMTALAQAAETANIWVRADGSNFMPQIVEAFNKSHENQIKLDIIPNAEIIPKYATAVAGGTAPDGLSLDLIYTPAFAAAGQLEDITDWAKSLPYFSQLSPAHVKTGTYKDRIYGLPFSADSSVLIWNKKLFKQAGMDGPPATMADFMEASRKISALGGGKTGYCLRGGAGATNGYMMMMANTYGSNEWFDQDGNSFLDKPEAVAGLQFLVDMYKNGYVSKDSVNWGFNEIVAGFYSGSCAMLDQDPDALIAVAEKMPKVDFAVAPMPLGPHDKAFPTIGYAGWAMFAASQHKDEAWKLIASLSSAEGNLEWSKFVGVIPTHKGADKDPFFATEQYKGWFTELNDPRWVLTAMPTYLEEFGYFADVLSIQGGQEALLGKRSAADVAGEWAKYLGDAQKKWLAAR